MKRILATAFIFLSLFVVANQAFAAIAFDTSNEDSGTGATVNLTYTVTGANPLILVAINIAGSPGDIVTGVTYAGVSLTRLATFSASTNKEWLYSLVGPATGANTLTVTLSTSKSINTRTTSYNGVSQTGFPDAQGQEGPAAGQTTLAHTLTTTADNSWMYGFIRNDTGDFTAGANTTCRNTCNAMAVVDSNGPVTPAGNRTLTVTMASSNAGGYYVTFAPVAVAPALRIDSNILFFQ